MRRYSVHRYRRKRRSDFRLILVIVVLFSLLFGICAEMRLPLVKEELQEAALRSFAEKRIAETVPAYLESLSVQHENNLVTLDTYALNDLKAELTCKLQDKLSGKTSVWIPLGNLTGVMLLNGHGVKVPVVFSVESTVSVAFESALESAGINRTRYAVYAVISAELYGLSSAAAGAVEVRTVYPVYEAVLEGDVPQVISSVR